jgi:Ca2+-binding RTX toxin-like protein
MSNSNNGNNNNKPDRSEKDPKGSKGGEDTAPNSPPPEPTNAITFRGGGNTDLATFYWEAVEEGAAYYYDGGGSPRKGEGDKLILMFTESEWSAFQESVDYEPLMAYIDRIAKNPSDSGITFTFQSINLTIKNWEIIELQFVPADSDGDGIPTYAEDSLAEQGFGSKDSNDDGIDDSEQPNVAVLAWQDQQTFEDGNNGEEVADETIISIQITDGVNLLHTAKLSDIQVIDDENIGLPPVESPWSPLSFQLSPLDQEFLDDTDTDADGTQIKVLITFAQPSFPEASYQYWKYISEATLDAYADASESLFDLDGNQITVAGWYDFTALDQQLGTSGDGARFIFAGGLLTAIELTFTDNAFGDSNPLIHQIGDPGTFGLAQPTIDVTGVDDVSEGSFAVFTVSLSTALILATEISLALGDAGDTADGDDYDSNFTAFYIDGDDNKQSLTVTGGKITLPAGVSTFYVSVETTDDEVFEGDEFFTLTATIGDDGPSDSDTATIKDDGTGTVYDEYGEEDTEATPDSDTPTIAVTGVGDVSEGSYAVFTVTLSNASASATEISLELGDDSDTADAGDDYNSTFTAFYIDGDDNKQSLTVTGGKITLPAGVSTFYVSVETTDDDDFEDDEFFTLTATIGESGPSDSATATIKDDGTGIVYDEYGEEDTEAEPDNDIVATPAPPVINTAETMWFYSQSSSGYVSYLNRIIIQQDLEDLSTTFKVSLSIGGDARMGATSSGGVTVLSGNGTNSLVLSGTLADINAYIASNKIQYDPNGSGASAPFPDRTVTINLMDTDYTVLATDTMAIKYINAENRTTLGNAGLYDAGTKLVNWAAVNINANDMESNSGEKIVSSWSHGPEQQSSSSPNLTYKKGGSLINLIFTGDQLGSILLDTTLRNNLRDWFGESNDLNTGNTAWNAKVEKEWATERIGLAAGTVDYVVWDHVVPTSGNTHVVATSGSNLDYNASSDQKLLVGGTGDNILTGGSNHDILAGGNGNDTLRGNGGNDLLLGGDGNDTLEGGAGNDILSGGRGADKFVFAHHGSANSDKIVDYSLVEGDTIDVSALLTGGKTLAEDIRLVQVGRDITVQFQSAAETWSNVVTLVGYGTESDFDPVKIVGESSITDVLYI